jgi:hypothetical protein
MVIKIKTNEKKDKGSNRNDYFQPYITLDKIDLANPEKYEQAKDQQTKTYDDRTHWPKLKKLAQGQVLNVGTGI